jgi:hypothetical protein
MTYGIPMATAAWEGAETLYIYEVDLLGVWTWWGDSIITYSMIQARNQENLLLQLLLCMSPSIIRLGLGLSPYDHRPQLKVRKHIIYMHGEDLIWVWSELGASIWPTSWYKWEAERISYDCYVLWMWDQGLLLGLSLYDHRLATVELNEAYLYSWSRSDWVWRGLGFQIIMQYKSTQSMVDWWSNATIYW